ncbi:unnamed protein product [Notodromas monacha]|uniref:Uncharacterized protein n=1 Tax=Notodromas monacha TaxID=399045 RepID=A0A7R9C448_9CRUS|nr:unnamed protein product [Notodromas monacha]CAG0925901.1 unnamed protein product [Notodromas monacha]
MDNSGRNVDPRSIRRLEEEEQPFLGSNDVAEIRLTPAWESRNLPPEQLNFQDVSPPDESEYGKEPPDR